MQNFETYQQLKSGDLRLIGKRTQDGIEKSIAGRADTVRLSPHGRTIFFARRRTMGRNPICSLVRTLIPGLQSQPVRGRSPGNGTVWRHVCLLIETLWSDPDFFLKRTQVDDIQNSIQEVVNIRRAMDLALSQPNVDAKRVALVGHDFGGMYGVLAGSLDQRPTHYVVMAATPRFPDWYLYAPKLEGEAREAFIREFSVLDPITHIPNLAPAPVLFQFGTDDPHVPKERADEFFQAAKDPKEIRWYKSGHGLNESAMLDRKNWLKEKSWIEGIRTLFVSDLLKTFSNY